MPARLEIIMVSTHDRPEVRATFMPRRPLSSFLSTAARISRPIRVWRSSNQSKTATTAAAANTAS